MDTCQETDDSRLMISQQKCFLSSRGVEKKIWEQTYWLEELMHNASVPYIYPRKRGRPI